MSLMIKDMVMAYQFGLKQLYYFNTYDGSHDVREELPSAVDDAANVMSKYEVFDGTLAEDCDDFVSRRSVN